MRDYLKKREQTIKYKKGNTVILSMEEITRENNIQILIQSSFFMLALGGLML